GGIGFAGDGLREKSLARARRANHQNAFGNAATEFLKFLRVFEELDQFRDFFLGFLDSGDVFEGGLVLLFAEHASFAFAEAQGAFAGHFYLADKEEPDHQTNHDNWEDGIKNAEQNRVRLFDFENAGVQDLLLHFVGHARLGDKWDLDCLA